MIQAFSPPRTDGHSGVDFSPATTNPRGSGKPLQTTWFGAGRLIRHALVVTEASLLFAQTSDLTSPVTT
jgi:hypothetical protein